MNKVKDFIKKQKVMLSCFCMSLMTLFFDYIYADSFEDAAKGAAKGIQMSASGATKYLITIALVVMGLAVGFGSQRQRETAKEHAPWMGIGIALVLGAAGISTLIWGWFSE